VRQEMGDVARSNGGYGSLLADGQLNPHSTIFVVNQNLGRKATHDDKVLMIKSHRSVTYASGCSSGEKTALSSNIPAKSAFRIRTAFWPAARWKLTKQKNELPTTNRAMMAPYDQPTIKIHAT